MLVTFCGNVRSTERQKPQTGDLLWKWKCGMLIMYGKMSVSQKYILAMRNLKHCVADYFRVFDNAVSAWLYMLAADSGKRRFLGSGDYAVITGILAPLRFPRSESGSVAIIYSHPLTDTSIIIRGEKHTWIKSSTNASY